MSTKKRVSLGRGLDALLGADTLDEVQAAAQQVQTVDVDQLVPGKYQPRQYMDPEALAELASSIASQGMIQPIVIRPISNNRYEILAGERRFRAAKQAGLTELPVIVYQISDDQALIIALIENIQREDLNAIEEAQAIGRLIDEFGLTHQEAAEKLGRSRSAISNLLRLLSLAEPIRELLLQKEIEMGHARALLSLEIVDQLSLAQKIVKEGLSVRQVEEKVRLLLEGASKAEKKPTTNQQDPDTQRLQNRLSDWLGAKTQISANPKGQGKVTIAFSDLKQLDGLLNKLGLPSDE